MSGELQRTPVERSGLRVLVVDDDLTIREMLTDLFELEGYEVLSAPNGLDALRIVCDLEPDIIVMDLSMPVMDAWTFRDEQRRRALALGAPMVLISALPDLPAQPSLLGAAAWFAKPFDLDTLLDAVRRLTRPQSAVA